MARGPTERGVGVPVFRDCQLHSEPGQRLRQAQLPRGDARPFQVCSMFSPHQFSTKVSLLNRIFKLFASFFVSAYLAEFVLKQTGIFVLLDALI